MDDEPDPTGARASRPERGPSLRARVVLVLLAINLAVFTAGGLWLQGTFDEAVTQRDRAFLAEVDASAREMVDRGGDLNVRRILQDRVWQRVDDVMIVDKNVERVAGRLVHRGVALNPRGIHEGSADREDLLEVLDEVLRTGSALPFAGGVALRIEERGGVWGAFWYRLPAELGSGSASAVHLLPWFLISTALLTAGSYYVLRGLVLEPVGALAAGVASLEAGDLDARVAVRSGSGELSRLVRGFNAMADEVQGAGARLEEEVRRATRQAREAEKAALTQRRLAAMGEFTAGIAHEINNPLSGVVGYSKLLLEKRDLPPDIRQKVQRISDSGERCRKIVEGVLLFSRQSGGDRAPVELSELIAGVVRIGEYQWKMSNCQVVQELNEPAWVMADSDQLEQVLLNLLSNAVDAMERGGTVRIALKATDTNAEIHVSDEGPGIPEEIQPNVFDPFFSTKSIGKGTGLGLSISYGIVRDHGGDILLESKPGEGAHFTVVLPRSTPEANDS